MAAGRLAAIPADNRREEGFTPDRLFRSQCNCSSKDFLKSCSATYIVFFVASSVILFTYFYCTLYFISYCHRVDMNVFTEHQKQQLIIVLHPSIFFPYLAPGNKKSKQRDSDIPVPSHLNNNNNNTRTDLYLPNHLFHLFRGPPRSSQSSQEVQSL